MVSLLIPLMIAGGFDGVEPLRDSATPRETLAAQLRQTACRKAKRSEIVIRRKPRMSGLSAAAARLGVSRTHLREVINGNRQSKHLMARLAKAGVKVEVA